jgi:hypothetical protein
LTSGEKFFGVTDEFVSIAVDEGVVEVGALALFIGSARDSRRTTGLMPPGVVARVSAILAPHDLRRLFGCLSRRGLWEMRNAKRGT